MKRTIADRRLNPVGLGCMGLSHGYATPPSPEEGSRILNRALDLGYDHIDTAQLYGLGNNETLIGNAIASRRKEFFLASKTGILIDGPKRTIDCSPERMLSSLEDSLKRLKTDYIDLYYMHRFDPKIPIADSVGAMVRAIEAGKIGAYGVSEWSAAHIREAHAIHPVAAVQTEYSLWTRNVEIAVLDTCRELDIAFVAFSPLARGVLANRLHDPMELPEGDIRRPMPRFSTENWPRNLALADRFNRLADQAGVTAAQLSLAWVLSRGEHVHAIPGTVSLSHLEENWQSQLIEVDAQILRAADALINQQTVSGHRYAEAMRPTIDTEDYEETA